MDSPFTEIIKDILAKNFGDKADNVYQLSSLIQYINIKTRSAQKSSKSRGSFANLYAIYVLVEDYLAKGYDKKKGYDNYEGARFSTLFARQRELPFGSKLQNHALNSRLNEEFKKFFPTVTFLPIIRNVENNRYWINENLLIVEISGDKYNLAEVIVDIINKYIDVKRESFELFIEDWKKLASLNGTDADVKRELFSLLEPQVDARIFEIVSFAILKAHYKDTKVYFGFDLATVKPHNLLLYKTGRTNANDGGIDFVMRPLGRFFQVTETLDVKKYFLDIEKIEHYPISFVVKTNTSDEEVKTLLKTNAQKYYSVNEIIERFMGSIEEIINIPKLKEYTEKVALNGDLKLVIDEIVLQSKIEFNHTD